MTSSLRARLLGLWLMSLFGSAVVAVLIIGLFRQTASAHLQRDRAVAARACEAITARYDFYTAGLVAPPARARFDAGLHAVLLVALRRFRGVAGGIQPEGRAARARTGSLPASLSGMIGTAVAAAAAAGRLVIHTDRGFAERTTIAACPLGGPVGNLAAFAVLRVDLLRSAFTRLAFGGLAVLLATLLASTAFLARLVLGFSRRLADVETALALDRPGALPMTGVAELDRLIAALNAATARLDAARARMAEAERLSALGRMAAGLAHEIRNPLGAIRLRAEGALAGDAARRGVALDRILAESARLERLTARLLGFAASPKAEPVPTPVALPFAEALASVAEAAAARGVTIETDEPGLTATFDPLLTGRALENLLRNAVEACGANDRVTLTARHTDNALAITLADTGPGIDPSLGDPFEPFVTGRADGVGLGLSIALEMIRAQGGTLTNIPSAIGAKFRITLPDPRPS